MIAHASTSVTAEISDLFFTRATTPFYACAWRFI
jgi:hypothetical protein